MLRVQRKQNKKKIIRKGTFETVYEKRPGQNNRTREVTMKTTNNNTCFIETWNNSEIVLKRRNLISNISDFTTNAVMLTFYTVMFLLGIFTTAIFVKLAGSMNGNPAGIPAETALAGANLIFAGIMLYCILEVLKTFFVTTRIRITPYGMRYEYYAAGKLRMTRIFRTDAICAVRLLKKNKDTAPLAGILRNPLKPAGGTVLIERNGKHADDIFVTNVENGGKFVTDLKSLIRAANRRYSVSAPHLFVQQYGFQGS